MTRRSRGKNIKAIIIFACLSGFTFISADRPALADPHQPRPPAKRMAPVQPPPGHRAVWVGGTRYFYQAGQFYHKRPSGFITVNAPIGAVVLDIPIGSEAVVVGGLTYYLFSGVYYRPVPEGFLVVEPPVVTTVVKETPPVVSSRKTMGEKVSVTARRLNVHSGPGMDFPVINQVQKGDLLSIHGYAPEWLYVKLRTGEFGWVMAVYTSPLSPPASG